MNIKKINTHLNRLFSGKVSAVLTDDSIVLSGSLDSWDDIVLACKTAVDKKSGKHVVNDIVLNGREIPKTRVPSLNDKSLDGLNVDVLVIGGGISGCSILRELTKWKISCLLVDKESDVACHASSRNDGEVHPGIDLNKGSLKQHYVLIGNDMYDKVCHDLDVPFKRVGQYVGISKLWLKPFVRLYVLQRRLCGVKGTKIIGRRKLRKLQPGLNKKFKYAVFSPTAGCVCPYNLTIAYAENAIQNGAAVSLNTYVSDMTVENGMIKSVVTNRGTVYPKIVVNAAGCFAEDVAKMAGDRFYSIHPRRGTNSILDKKTGGYVTAIAGIKGAKSTPNTKGGGILHTVHDNLLVGPNAVETYEKENFATDAESINGVFKKQSITSPLISKKDIITYFTGVRAPTFEEDFIIEKGHKTKNLVHCAGIQSPGLTTAPAVALDVSKMCVDMLGGAEVNKDFNPVRQGIPHLADMPLEERDRLIKQNPDYGVIVCRCEEVSKGEIIDALSRPLPVHTVDGVKRRVRPGMGRCQGGFCQPLVTKIISDYTGKNITSVVKGAEGSIINYSQTKEGK